MKASAVLCYNINQLTYLLMDRKAPAMTGQTDGRDRPMDRRTPDCYVEPALYKLHYALASKTAQRGDLHLNRQDRQRDRQTDRQTDREEVTVRS